MVPRRVRLDGRLVAEDDGLDEHQSLDTDQQQSPVWSGLAGLGEHP